VEILIGIDRSFISGRSNKGDLDLDLEKNKGDPEGERSGQRFRSVSIIISWWIYLEI